MTTATVLLLYASAVAGHQLRRFGVSPLERKRLARDMLGQAGVLWGIELPVLFSAMFFSVSIFDELRCFAGARLWTNATAQLATVFAASMVVVASGGRYWQFFLADRVSTTLTRGQRARSITWGLIVIAAATAITSLSGAAALVGAAEAVAGSSLSPATLSFAFVSAGVPAVISALSLMVVLDMGLLGRNLFDEHREWWSRMGAWLNILSLAWLALCSLALYSPLLVELTNQAAGKFVVSAGGLGWVAWTAAGVVLGREQTPENIGGLLKSPRTIRWVIALAPYVFILGLLVLLSAATFAAMSGIAPSALTPAHLDRAHPIAGTQWHWMLLWPPALLGLAFLLSWRVDVNEFSMHHFYKNRLVRCYLGATRDQRSNKPERTPDPFTGFDSTDDLKLAYLNTTPGGGVRATRDAKRRRQPAGCHPVRQGLCRLSTRR